MNKLLFLFLLSITFIGDVKSNEEHIHEPIGKPLYFTAKKYAPACFYTEDNFQGESVCLTPPMMMDFYNTKDHHFNDNISSIKIPEDVHVTIYKNDNYNQPSYKLMESINLSELKKIDMSGEISAVITAQSPGFCDENCVILTEQKIELEEVFNKYHGIKHNTNKLILMNFEVNKDSDFFVGFIDYPLALVIGNDLFFYTTAHNKPLNMRLRENTDNLSLLFKLNENSLQFQYLAAKGTEPLNTPFWINAKYSYEKLPTLYISNGIPTDDEDSSSEHLTPLILNKTIIALNKHPQRSKRGLLGLAACVGIPVLAIYNLVTHGHCNQLDRLVGMNEFSHDDGEGKTLVVAGPATPLPPVKPSTGSPLEQPTPATLVLTHLNTHLHNQALTLPAAARVCNTSIDNIIAARYPRQTGIRCGSRLSMLLADFTLLFGESLLDWTTDHLIHVLQLINEQGTTGYAGSDQETESQLVEGVQQAISDLGIQPLTEMLQDAFNDAVLNYTQYLMQNEEQESLATPLAAQDLPMGDYTLFLEQYTHPEERPTPLIMDDNQWITPENLYFEVMVIPGGDHHLPTNLTEEILEVIDTWRTLYSQVGYKADNTGRPLTSRDRTIYAARVTSYILSELLSANPSDYQFVIVKLKGKIISVLASQNNENGEDSYLNFSVTAPQHVLTPDQNGSVRGAGTAAVRELARYLKEKGKKTLSAYVISQPSAKVKLKIGFVRKDEL
ncbi:beta/gamma crystallin domain-containing protein [Yersinia rochesterensis]|uniref:peptidase inhibitor family I36 protein n=1 Tax=Yersinia TaxID=629 RepID=UPI0022403272|nr:MULTISPECIES: peptidase inhibitor family I36 protein [Yersinia]MDA5542603.1 beta/gamma crystallin domain-containing protein [Yersinia rochesterensis]UZM75146.1 beta/gamma crystallin domain-containing protein [Yersinia sp. SCPM-O-B-9106 (C-191)]